MTSRLNESSGSNFSARSEARPNQVSLSSQPEEEGCPVIEESGTVCGETRTLNIIEDFRRIYDDCVRKMEGNKDENLALRKLAPFRKLVEDLWEQNAMLVETVEELEQEATNRVAVLQNKLDECSEKVNEYLQDIDSLVEVIRRFRENGVIDSSGLKFSSICDLEIHGYCKSRFDKIDCNKAEESNVNEKCDKIPERNSRKSNLRDMSTNTNEYCPGKDSTDTSRSVSCQSDLLSSTICDDFFSKSALKLQKLIPRPEKCFVCFTAKANCECEDSNNFYSTPDEELSIENLLKDNCGLVEANESELIKPQSDLKLEEGENIESFFSAEDCTKETDNGRNLLGDTLENEKKMLKNATDTQILERGRVNRSRYRESRYGDGFSDSARPVNISFNLINEPACYEKEICDCDCNICGCHYCDG